MSEEVTIIILGGTGDLAKKKLLPSLFRLYEKGKLEEFDIIGTSRHEYTDKEYCDEATEHLRGKSEKKKLEEFRNHIHFAKLNYYEIEEYGNLEQKLRNCRGHRLFYFATLPQHFETITENLAKQGIVDERSKILYEKPFGSDLESARKLNECIHKTFSEDKVYRIDHYLNKELIGNIAILRFTNTMMEPIWNSSCIDNVQIIMSEEIGVDERREFYDRYGAIKDVFQNHLLQLLALIGMEEPEKFDSRYIRDKKVELLHRAAVADLITGQYEGYRSHDGVADDSETETFAAMKIQIDNERWKGVPFYLVSGKNLEKAMVRLYIEFTNSACELFEGICPLLPNQLIISLKPEEKVYFTINTKTPGEMNMTPAKMEFAYSALHGYNTPEAYENVFHEAIRGNQTAFVRSDEIEAAWRVIDEIEKPKPFTYKSGEFPDAAREFLKKDGKSWNELEDGE